jgi:hypothetical protein
MRRWTKAHGTLWLSLSVLWVAGSAQADWAGIVPPDRITTWNPGLRAIGGIPNRTSVCATLLPNGDADDTARIQTALNACVDGVVVLGAGDFHITGAHQVRLPTHTTLRGGVDAHGRPSTRVILSPDHVLRAFSIGEGGPDENFLRQPNNLTADGTLNATSVTVANNPGYVAGELVTINQLYDSSLWLNESHFGTPGAERNRNFFCRTNRFIGQVNEVQSVTGSGPYTLTFTAPLHARFTVANQAQVWRHSRSAGSDAIITAPIERSGLENLYIEGGADGGAVVMTGAKYCWFKNLEVYDWRGVAVSLTRCFRGEYRDSYVHQTHWPAPGGGGYILSVDWQAADNLIENNIHWAANKVMVMRSSGGGNVIAYNYVEDGFGFYYPTIVESGLNASHYAGSHMELFEGNEGFNFAGDIVWGNALTISVLRNHMTGLRRNVRLPDGTFGATTGGTTDPPYQPVNFQQDAGGRTMVTIGATHDYYSLVGNVLGYPNMPSPGAPWRYENTSVSNSFPAIWNVGTAGSDPPATEAQHQQTLARTLRHGNWDYGYTNGIVWDPAIADHDIPSSLYLTARPAFFGSSQWPWVDPYTGTTYTLPARARFDAILAPLPATQFYTLAPCRAIDTRSANPPALAGGSVREFALAGVTAGSCQVPADAVALAANITVARSAQAGHLTFFPANGTIPNATHINFRPGVSRANNAVLLLATNGSGRLRVLNGSTGATDLILDITGFFK